MTNGKQVWIESHGDCGSYNLYNDPDIVCAGRIQPGVYDDYTHITMETLKNMVDKVIAERTE
jgi:hypothetical protein